MLQVFGVGYHHSGLAAPARMAIEALVKQGQLRFVVATMGLSLGINFSVRSALISDFQRPGEAGFTDYGPSEVLQMLGRAGRRGKDAVGFSLWPSVEAYQRLAGARRDVISSRLRNDPTTFLGLVGRGFSLRAIEHFYGKSFRRFQEPGFDLTLITRTRLAKKLGSDDLPCASPAAEAARFSNDDKSSKCFNCPFRGKCHPILEAKSIGPLAMLHLHLHKIGALDRDEGLTPFGSIARYFPQSGGLLLARRFASGEISAQELPQFCQLAAALTMARFKEPGADPHYKWPFNPEQIEDELEALYPYEMFEELYDPPFGRRPYPVLRELNPAAGYMVREWMKGMAWKELIARVTHEQFGTGDVMSLIYRTATYLQSIIQADLVDLKDTARAIRENMLREPLSFVLSI
jgi:superfamily II RNA helicase